LLKPFFSLVIRIAILGNAQPAKNQVSQAEIKISLHNFSLQEAFAYVYYNTSKICGYEQERAFSFPLWSFSQKNTLLFSKEADQN
jgi:hypothetical protein